MKIVKIIGFIIIGLCAIIGIAVLVSPSETHIARSTIIQAPSKLIYQDLLIFKNFNTWSPWADKDPNIRWEYYGPLLGTGAGMKWYSEDPQVGNGEMTLQDATYPTSITYRMDFGYSKANATVFLNESEGETEVTWTYDEVDISGFYKLFALMTESFLGPDYEKGLAQLKSRMETAPSLSVDMEIMMSTARNYIGPKDTLEAPIEMVSTKLAQSFGEILRYAGKEGLAQEGQPITVYLEAGEVFRFVPGIPMTTDSISDASLMLRSTPEGYELRASYYGPYEAMETTYLEMEQLIDFYNMKSAGPPWEEYITDPGNEPKAENWLTYIHWPIQYKE
jgi:effector-binding domain-containing protein